jgi:hypothetical protein
LHAIPQICFCGAGVLAFDTGGNNTNFGFSRVALWSKCRHFIKDKIMMRLYTHHKFMQQIGRIVKEKAFTISTPAANLIITATSMRRLCHVGRVVKVSEREKMGSIKEQRLFGYSHRRHSQTSSEDSEFPNLGTRLGMLLGLGAGTFIYVVNQYSSPAECAAAARSCFWWGRGNGTLPEKLPEQLARDVSNLSFGPTHACAVDGRGNAWTWSLEDKHASAVDTVKGKSIVAVATGSSRTYALTS